MGVQRRFGHLKLGPRPKGGESEGPILNFEFVSDFGIRI